jgi:MFS family permease
VVVTGAGPLGLAAAVHLLDRGLEPLVLEAGPEVGDNIAQWRRVRLFSPWRGHFLRSAGLRLRRVFGSPWNKELGWSRTALTGAYATATIVAGVAAVPVGRWLDQHGARGLMTAGSAAATVLALAWAHVSDLAAFYVIWAGIGLAMAAVLYERASPSLLLEPRPRSPRPRSAPAPEATSSFSSLSPSAP